MSLLERLRQDVGANAWPIQDLTVWPQASKVFEADDGWLLISGHPASRGCPTILLGGNPAGVRKLMPLHLPPEPFVIRETDGRLEDVIREHLPRASYYRGQRMETNRETFRPDKGSARRLLPSDLNALAEFNGAPPQAAASFAGWLNGAAIFGAFHEGKIAALASSLARVDGAWMIGAVSTLPNLRGRGFGTAVTGALTAFALETVPIVTLTVNVENASAIRIYEKLGYVRKDSRIWVSAGTNAAP